MKRIFVIEDDFYIRDLYVEFFTQSGYEVVTATDGQQALEKVKGQGKFDVILLDIMLPQKSGIDVLKVFKSPEASTKDTPVFMLTNLGDENIIKEAFKLGADGYFLKVQLTPGDIINEIEAFLAKQNKVT
ncbi:hypothetical protein A3D00_01450 [Candidatus Woesebacteria bacterium RIFCSPHIGHO2_02_FULL_38_9]|uniref:Response regulatory domain-containing protein n=1 Tax=Candidatus Woesebacteria bacterium RIFCSPHIGHO2_01_FULL_39_28 TaxID=1802496 RepID=A0A1F7YHD8_9BACT|nr:MAG: hypothetical protein A2627_04065 [Candidatus Woesebacteria bacterium RIFCSPHIGHO2_01_FULL_39_28]OGM34699.1 MAG: hypothetical protein A3D00_01450 [Candidatus Woesebacteria bacterium RIFCSPHIGHO2_02_FULL_38_9]OGM58671.1 MAG: hypothetical protein A3A50_02720 [Candidatus Woesebacteria bacterium RIFCSPLOWO2_01_FULL_38_20]